MRHLGLYILICCESVNNSLRKWNFTKIKWSGLFLIEGLAEINIFYFSLLRLNGGDLEFNGVHF